MRSFKEIKRHYNFTEEDEQRLRSLKEIAEANMDGAMDALHSWMIMTADTARFFDEEKRKSHVFGSQKKWFLDLFSGNYGSQYYERLIKIGQTHVRFLVEAHYMNRAVNIVRNYCVGVLNQAIEDSEERAKSIIAVEKILDINLDVITSSYIEEELRTYSGAYHVKNVLISFSEAFSKGMNFVLILALIGLSIGVVYFLVHAVQNFLTGDLEHAIITSLGSILILWIVIELMNTEIDHLKGGKFHISVFVGVALVAFIRETMIATLQKESPEKIYYLIAAIFVTGVVYWLAVKTEMRG
ncbi:MAG TPA: heme-binding sensor globin domain-containing protein [Nitrospiraceae bacterium]|jgi:uncharacterized membrane protein (DUF373 family)|nr:heme-binding sensor globin domain-containing protein [Nitrospiraceae bacterium]